MIADVPPHVGVGQSEEAIGAQGLGGLADRFLARVRLGADFRSSRIKKAQETPADLL
ncbi:hypothetical protein [Arenibaculum pallidiluteum]|uniref:hypothetical protein n=1 Tax=Arenibaculum pallidiluteum TaxID=2812559 RepID=UPI001A95D2D8|nr:hypothetical protein [Arenibaculum pallidiluteum]